MNLPSGYVDSFGVSYDAGIIVPTDIMMQTSQELSIRHAKAGYEQLRRTSVCRVTYRAVIYVSQQAMDEGKKPLPFSSNSGTEYFNFEIPIDSAPTAVDDIVALCETDLSNRL